MAIKNQSKKSLKSQWLNLMLHFSGVINKYKLKVIETTGPKIILYGLFVLLLEVINIIIALPAYAFISSKEFVPINRGSSQSGTGNDKNAITTYRLRRIMSLSALFGVAAVVAGWGLVAFFGLVIFPGTSHASVASWDFNTPLAYHYDTTKIQIIDGTAIFKATPAPAPVVVTAPVATTTPTPAPVVASTPATTTVVPPPVATPLVTPPSPPPMPTLPNAGFPPEEKSMPWNGIALSGICAASIFFYFARRKHTA